ncbi:MAG: signal peptidase I [Actinomycetota bacterium]
MGRPGGVTGGAKGDRAAQTGETENSAFFLDERAPAGGEEQPPGDSKKEDRERGGLLSFFRELPGLILVAFVLALLIKTFLVQAFYIPSASMVPTLQVGDRVLVNKLVYDFGVPQRYDVIVFEDPNAPEPDRGFFEGIWNWLTEGLGFATEAEQDFIKRVIGLPGDELEIKEGQVFINGEPIDDPPTVQPDQSTFGPVTIEEDKVFVMGDNRANSSDSRFLLGQISYDKIVGKAFVLLWPPSRLEWLSDD